jgi:hypothetical protein
MLNFLITGMLGVVSAIHHNHTCSMHYKLNLDSSLSSTKFCTHRSYYIHHICQSLSHHNVACHCEITQFDGKPCTNGICLCSSGNATINAQNVTLQFHVSLARALNVSGLPSYIKIHSPDNTLDDYILSVVLTAAGVLLCLYFTALICKLYLKYMGYQKINLPKQVDEEKGARTHDVEVQP